MFSGSVGPDGGGGGGEGRGVATVRLGEGAAIGSYTGGVPTLKHT